MVSDMEVILQRVTGKLSIATVVIDRNKSPFLFYTGKFWQRMGSELSTNSNFYSHSFVNAFIQVDVQMKQNIIQAHSWAIDTQLSNWSAGHWLSSRFQIWAHNLIKTPTQNKKPNPCGFSYAIENV